MENLEAKMGAVRISQEVIASIAGLAATEVKGVAALAGDIKNDMVTRSGSKLLSKAVQVQISEEEVKVKVSVILDGTVSIPQVSEDASERVSAAIESMTGKTVTDVQVVIAGVSL